MCIVVCLLVEIIRSVPLQSSCGAGRKRETSRRAPFVGQQNDTIHAANRAQSEKPVGTSPVVQQIDVFIVSQCAPTSTGTVQYRILTPFIVGEILLCVCNRKRWRTASTPSEEIYPAVIVTAIASLLHFTPFSYTLPDVASPTTSY